MNTKIKGVSNKIDIPFIIVERGYYMKIILEINKEDNTIEITSDEPIKLKIATKILLSVTENCLNLIDTEGENDINEIGRYKDTSFSV